MQYLILFFVIASSYSKSCKQYADLATYLNTKKFIQASRDHRSDGKEPTIKLEDVNQAKSIAYRFPAFKDLGFGQPGSEGWKRYRGDLDQSKLFGTVVGWEIRSPNGHARVRIDWDKKKGAHYNIEITEKGKQQGTHKLCIKFDCGGTDCTEEQVLKMAKKMEL